MYLSTTQDSDLKTNIWIISFWNNKKISIFLINFVWKVNITITDAITNAP